MDLALYVFLGVSVGSPGSCVNNTVASVFCLRWSFGVAVTIETLRLYSRCSASSVVAVDPIDLFFALLRAVDEKGVADCTFFERTELSTKLVYSLPSFRLPE